MKERIYIKELKSFIGKEVMIAGWVDVRRDQGKMIFLDFRDMTGKVQGSYFT
jgi:aspartyl-tRNA synthetase